MTVQELLELLRGVDPLAPIYVRAFGSLHPILGVQLVRPLNGPLRLQPAIHFTTQSDVIEPVLDPGKVMQDMLDRIAPKRPPWEGGEEEP